MALTIERQAYKPIGGAFEVHAKVTFDASYPTGGESLTPANLGLTTIQTLDIYPSAGYLFDYDATNQKLKALTPLGAHAVTARTFPAEHGGKDIKGSANTDSENADAAALPTNGALVAAETAVAAGAYTAPSLTNPDTGRNVCIAFHNDSGGALNLYEGVMTFTVTGKWRGADQTDTVTFTSTAGNKAVANTKYRYKYGVKPFDTVTGVTLDNACDDGLKIAVGIGSLIGLPMDLATPAEADVLKITKNAADLAPTGIVDTANMTVGLGTLADGDDFTIIYLTTSYVSGIAGNGAAAAAAEVTNGTNLSTLTCRLVATGL